MQLSLSDSDNFPFLLLGNKSDIPEKAVEETIAREYAMNNGDMLFYEVSSKTGDNIQETFEVISKQVLEKAHKDDFQIPSSVVQIVHEPESKPNKFMNFFFSSIFQRNNQEQIKPLKEETKINQNIQKVKTRRESDFEMNPANKTIELQTQLENQTKEFESMKEEFEMQLENKDKEIATKDEELKKMQNQIEIMKKEHEKEIQHLKEATHLSISDKPNDNLDS